jgi:hypothetical protein
MAQAEASRQLAESSLQNSSVMRSIAIDSSKVALLTRRDSTDMRIIAAVTLAFLPGTFTAVSFPIAHLPTSAFDGLSSLT